VQQQGEFTIKAGIEDVWEGLNDEETLKASIPGCENIERVDEQTLRASVRTKVGLVDAVFKLTLKLSNVTAPFSYTLNGDVEGGAGSVQGHADVRLAPVTGVANAQATVLTYTVNATVGGKLAQVGSRLVDSTAARMAEDFFAVFSEKCMKEADTQDLESPTADESSAKQDKSEPVERAQDGINFIWMIAFAVLITAMVLAL